MIQIRLYDGDKYQGTFSRVAAEEESRRLGGRLKLGRAMSSYVKGVVTRDATTVANRSNERMVRVLYGITNMGEMTWMAAKANTPAWSKQTGGLRKEGRLPPPPGSG